MCVCAVCHLQAAVLHCSATNTCILIFLFTYRCVPARIHTRTFHSDSHTFRHTRLLTHVHTLNAHMCMHVQRTTYEQLESLQSRLRQARASLGDGSSTEAVSEQQLGEGWTLVTAAGRTLKEVQNGCLILPVLCLCVGYLIVSEQQRLGRAATAWCTLGINRRKGKRKNYAGSENQSPY